MGGGSGKGGSQTQVTQLPAGLEQGANEVLAAGMKAAALPYSPNRGVTIASMTDPQKSALRGANSMAGAYGVGDGNANLNIPASRVDPATGISGYSTGALYDYMLNESMTPEDIAKREESLRNYSNAGNRIYRAAGINPADTGAPPPVVTNPVLNGATGNNPNTNPDRGGGR